MRNFDNHVNEYGFLVQETGNDLDSPQRMGMFHMGNELRKANGLPAIIVPKVIDAHRTTVILESTERPGNYMRSPDPESRGHYDDMMTRDQQTGIIACLLVSKHKNGIKRLMTANMKRGWFVSLPLLVMGLPFLGTILGWFTNNTTAWRVDRELEPELVGTSKANFGGLSQFAMCLRGLKLWWTRPILELLDTELIYGAIKYRWFEKQREPINFMLRCGVASNYYPTLTGWIARKITNPDDMYEKLVRYMDRGPHLAPPMQVVWDQELMKRIFV